MKYLILQLLPAFIATGALAQSPAILQSQAIYEVSGSVILIDSLVHKHHGGRTSTPHPISLDFTYPANGNYNEDTTLEYFPQNGPLVPLMRYTRSFNSAGLLTQYRWEQLQQSTNQYKELYKLVYSYNAAMLPDVVQRYNGGVHDQKIYHSYQNGKLLARITSELQPGGGGWKDVIADSFTVSGTDSVYARHSLPAGTAFERRKFVRDAGNRVLIDSAFTQGALWKVTYSQYDALGRIARDSIFNTLGGISLKYVYKQTYQYDNNGNLTSRYTHHWNVDSNKYTGIYIDSMEYNGAGQLTACETYFRGGGNQVHPADGYWRYYYYGFPTGVDEVVHDDIISLYPIPATSYINLQMNFSEPEAFSVRIFDMQGRLLRHWDEPAQAAYSRQVSLQGMPAGNYLLQVYSAGHSLTRQFSVVR